MCTYDSLTPPDRDALIDVLVSVQLRASLRCDFMWSSVGFQLKRTIMIDLEVWVDMIWCMWLVWYMIVAYANTIVCRMIVKLYLLYCLVYATTCCVQGITLYETLRP